MCTYSISINDTLIEQLKTTLGSDSDVHNWMQHQMELAVLHYILQLKSKNSREESLHRIIDISETDGNDISLRNFKGILPTPETPINVLRDEYIKDKYGL